MTIHPASHPSRPTGGPEPVPPPTPPRRGPAPPPPPKWRSWLIPVGVLLTVWLLFGNLLLRATIEQLDYSSFLTQLEAGEIAELTIDPDGAVRGILTDETVFQTQIPTALDPGELTARLEEHDVTIQATGPQVSLGQVLGGLLPLLVLVGLFVWMGRRAKGQLGGITAFGRSKAKVVDTQRPTTGFSDVAGYAGVKREIGEVVDFLKAPDRYRRAGAIGPRGVLMVGPPGTGKTLLARAVAGEAQVPFLSVTGSSFVEMYVGVGAARVRDLFEEARKRAPAIVFIDEIDAIGSRRAGGAAVSNDEREQTLNQLLAEMDGFDPAVGIVVLAATNRPEVLDAALMRPGRFDRQVVVPLPNRDERREILAVHTRSKPLADDVDLDLTARATPGFSGADLANLANEAAIAAVRENRQRITADDLETARERLVLGRRDGATVLLPEEKQRVAVHEAGHALVAVLSDHADPVAKVTILPAGSSLGATHQLPVDERHLHTEEQLNDTLAVQLAGRAAELVVFGTGSTGAAADLTNATRLATKMAREYGLATELGPIGYGADAPMYLGNEAVRTREYAEVTQFRIDDAVRRLLTDAEQRAADLLLANRDRLDALAALLLEEETVDGATVHTLARRPTDLAEPTPAPAHRRTGPRHPARPLRLRRPHGAPLRRDRR
jgi:cell division protease FtsH